MAEGTIASLTPTIAALFGVPAPAVSAEPPLDSVLRHFAGRRSGGVSERGLSERGLSERGRIERCLIYCPDALGNHLWSHFPDEAERIARCCPHRASVSAVIPPKTPVCFASAFTGAPPEVHGIRRYERPVLACDTLFDALTRSGRKVAIIAVRDSSVDLIFRNRRLDYFSEPYDAETTERALSVIASDAHDLVVVYHQEYDDQLHRTQPFSPECIEAMRNHVAAVGILAEAARAAWARRSYAMVVAPDHGAHLDTQTGRGDHGLDIPEDVSVSHWYGLFRAQGREGDETS